MKKKKDYIESKDDKMDFQGNKYHIVFMVRAQKSQLLSLSKRVLI